MQKVVTIEIHTHFDKDVEEHFKDYLTDGWRITSMSTSAAKMDEARAVCWITVVLEKE